MPILLEAVLIGLVVGIIVGALGAGGGILSVPVLVYLLHQDPHAAAMSSLVIVGITAVFSLPHHVLKHNVDWAQGGIFGTLAIGGTFLGSRLSVLMPARVLMLLFAVMLLVVAFVMLRRGVVGRREENRTATVELHDDAHPTGIGDPEPAPKAHGWQHWVRVLLTASFTGFLTGFFGVGGGFIVVPMLVIALGLPIRKAAGTSLVVMLIATASGLLSRVGANIVIDWPLTLLFTLGGAIGGVIGGPLAAKARPSTLTFIFSGLLFAVTIYTFINTVINW